MANPMPYERGFSFAGFQSTSPQTPLPGPRVDAELDNVERTTTDLISGLGDIRRSDGKLKNGVVTLDSLSPEITTGVQPAVAWTPLTQYEPGAVVFFNTGFYRALISHVSSPAFATDLATGKWYLFADLGPIVVDAGVARDQAVAAATTATTAAGTASSAATTAVAAKDTAITQAGSAATSAGTAATQAGVATTQAGVATTQAGLATTAKTAAEAAAASAAASVIHAFRSVTRFSAADGNMSAGQTVFTVPGGYDPGFAEVERNGLTLVNGQDVTVTSGTTFTLAVGVGGTDTVVFKALGIYNVANVPASAVNYDPAATGGVGRSVNTKLQECPSLRDFGAVGDGTADDTAAWANFIAAVTASATKRGYVPAGTYKITSQPADITTTLLLHGDGMNSTVLQRAYNGTTGKGLLAFGPGSNGSIFRDMAVRSSVGTTGGSLLSIVATAGGAPPSFLTFENMYLTTSGTDTHQTTVYVDGTARTTAPIGCRDISFKNVHIFGANGYSLYLAGAVGFSFQGGGCYAAGGTNAASGGIQITGNGTTVNSQYITTDIVTCNGFNLTNCSDLQLKSASIGSIGGVSVNNAGSCTWTAVYGHPSGTVTGSWVNSGIYRPTGFATT